MHKLREAGSSRENRRENGSREERGDELSVWRWFAVGHGWLLHALCFLNSFTQHVIFNRHHQRKREVFTAPISLFTFNQQTLITACLNTLCADRCKTEQGSADPGDPEQGRMWYLIHLAVVHTEAYRPILTMYCVTLPSFPSPAWQLIPSEVFIFHVQVICMAVNAPSHLGEFQSCMLCECGVTGQGVICKCCWNIYCLGWCGKVFHNRVRQEWWIWCLRPQLMSLSTKLCILPCCRRFQHFQHSCLWVETSAHSCSGTWGATADTMVLLYVLGCGSMMMMMMMVQVKQRICFFTGSPSTHSCHIHSHISL